MYFSPHNVLCMRFLLFVLNQCNMLVADWGHRGSESVIKIKYFKIFNF